MFACISNLPTSTLIFWKCKSYRLYLNIVLSTNSIKCSENSGLYIYSYNLWSLKVISGCDLRQIQLHNVLL